MNATLPVGKAQRPVLLRAAAEYVAAEVQRRKVRREHVALDGSAALEVRGAFVTLRRAGELRGCCGTVGGAKPLAEAIEDASRRTATRDPRLPPVAAEELPHLTLDVSLLHRFRRIKACGAGRCEQVAVGRHGLHIRSGGSAGLLLPKVAVDYAWDAEIFLRQVCVKAGLPHNAWQDDGAELMTFEADAFGGPFDQDVLRDGEQTTTAANFTSRQPAVAGSFYPGGARSLDSLAQECFGGEASPLRRWAAAMLPHAGLVFSGRVAAETLKQIAPAERVIVLGPKHTRLGEKWAVAPHAVWSLPGGDVAGDADLARRLAATVPGWRLDTAAHEREHAIEVELPLLRHWAPQAKVAGVALGVASLEECRTFAGGLAKVIASLPKPPLLVISSDMNHFASDEENRRLDEIALQAMESLDAARLHQTVREHQISMCGVIPAVVVMETLRRLDRLKTVRRTVYATSGDGSGDRSRVVGYAGVLLGG